MKVLANIFGTWSRYTLSTKIQTKPSQKLRNGSADVPSGVSAGIIWTRRVTATFDSHPKENRHFTKYLQFSCAQMASPDVVRQMVRLRSTYSRFWLFSCFYDCEVWDKWEWVGVSALGSVWTWAQLFHSLARARSPLLHKQHEYKHPINRFE